MQCLQQPTSGHYSEADKSTPGHPSYFLEVCFHITFPLPLGLANALSLQVFRLNVFIYRLSHVFYMTRPFRPPCFSHHSNIWY
jgi:hypothetical protein